METFGLYSDRVIELLNRALTPMYRRVFQRYWDNSMFARMRRPYFESDIESGYYEIYIPTFEDPEGFNMGYYRMVVQVLPELDKEITQREEIKLRKTRVCNGHGPAGRPDSELVAFIAPKLTREAAKEYRLYGKKAKSLPTAHRTYPESKGYFTWVGIHNIPETIVKRLLNFIGNFFWKRLRALIKSLKFENLIGEYSESSLYYIVANILETRNLLSLSNAIRCLHHTLNWIEKMIAFIWAELGKQAKISLAVEKMRELKPLLKGIPSDSEEIEDAFFGLRRLLDPEVDARARLLDALRPHGLVTRVSHR